MRVLWISLSLFGLYVFVCYISGNFANPRTWLHPGRNLLPKATFPALH